MSCQLGRYPGCQHRLLEELDRAGGDSELLDLDALIELPYLSACFNESLRMYPASGWASKTCTRDYELLGSHKAESVKLRPGDNVMIPDFYPEPGEFRPELFLDGGLKRFKQQGVLLGLGNGQEDFPKFGGLRRPAASINRPQLNGLK